MLPAVFFAASNGMGILSWTRGPGEVLAETCQLVLSTPRFLAAQRSAVSSRREEIAVVALARKYKRVCGPLCDPMGSRHEATLSAASTVFASTLVLDCNCKPVCSSFNDQTAEQQLTVFRRRKAFCSENPCGGLRWGWGPRAVGSIARAKKFPEEICFAPRRVFQICRTPDDERSKVRNTPDWENLCTGQPRVPEGPSPSVSGRVQGTPSKGFLWATSSRRLDTALLFADKKRGVETTRLAGYCQSTSGPWTTGPAKAPAAGLGSKALAAGSSKNAGPVSSGDFRYLICCYMP